MVEDLLNLGPHVDAHFIEKRDRADWETKVLHRLVDGLDRHTLFEQVRRFVHVGRKSACGEEAGTIADYDVVLGNYVGPRWPTETEQDFVKFIESGHGYVAVHSADNAFPDWPEYNRICGVGGWYGRKEHSGPHVYLDDADLEVRDTSVGSGGHHGPQHEYPIRIRDSTHPITRGLPATWLHTKDELYDSLRGPATEMHILATAYSDPKFDGTSKHEPMLMTITYQGGRVFHTVLGHADYSMKCAGFVTTLLRGTEWAATGDVTIPIPENFPTAEKTSPVE